MKQMATERTNQRSYWCAKLVSIYFKNTLLFRTFRFILKLSLSEWWWWNMYKPKCVSTSRTHRQRNTMFVVFICFTSKFDIVRCSKERVTIHYLISANS